MDIAEDLPRILFLLTFVLIGLFRWIANTIAERRAGKDTEDDPLEQDWEPPTTTQGPPPVPQPAVPDQLRDFFDSLNREPEPQPEPVLPPVAPPSLPSLTPAEQAALKRVKTAAAHSKPTTAHRPTASKAHRLRSQLADPRTLRHALVLKEILDQPKALKTPGTLGSF